MRTLHDSTSQEMARQQAQFQLFFEESKEQIIQAVRTRMFASTPMGHCGSDMMRTDQYSTPSERTSPLPQGLMRPPGGLTQLNSRPRQTNQVIHKAVGPWIEGLRKHCASLR